MSWGRDGIWIILRNRKLQIVSIFISSIFFFNKVETRACIRHALADLTDFLERKNRGYVPKCIVTDTNHVLTVAIVTTDSETTEQVPTPNPFSPGLDNKITSQIFAAQKHLVVMRYICLFVHWLIQCNTVWRFSVAMVLILSSITYLHPVHIICWNYFHMLDHLFWYYKVCTFICKICHIRVDNKVDMTLHKLLIPLL